MDPPMAFVLDIFDSSDAVLLSLNDETGSPEEWGFYSTTPVNIGTGPGSVYVRVTSDAVVPFEYKMYPQFNCTDCARE